MINKIVKVIKELQEFRINLLKKYEYYGIFDRAVRIGMYVAVITFTSDLTNLTDFNNIQLALITGVAAGVDKFKNIILAGLRNGENILHIKIKK